jgi:hypothetical protein
LPTLGKPTIPIDTLIAFIVLTEVAKGKARPLRRELFYRGAKLWLNIVVTVPGGTHWTDG